MDKKIWIASIIAFALGFFAAWLVFRADIPLQSPEDVTPIAENGKADKASSTKSDSKVSTGMSGEGIISVSDQEFGDVVSISSVSLDSAGWIAIHEDRDGGPGNILGAGWFPQGTSEDAEIELLRGTVPGATYYAVLRSDDGDREFDHLKDAPFEDEEGKALQTAFQTFSLKIE